MLKRRGALVLALESAGLENLRLCHQVSLSGEAAFSARPRRRVLSRELLSCPFPPSSRPVQELPSLPVSSLHLACVGRLPSCPFPPSS